MISRARRSGSTMSTVTAHIAVSLDGYAAGRTSPPTCHSARASTAGCTPGCSTRRGQPDEIDGIVNAGANHGPQHVRPGAESGIRVEGMVGIRAAVSRAVYVLTHHRRSRSRWTAARRSVRDDTGPSPRLAGQRPRGRAGGDRGGAATLNRYCHSARSTNSGCTSCR